MKTQLPLFFLVLAGTANFALAAANRGRLEHPVPVARPLAVEQEEVKPPSAAAAVDDKQRQVRLIPLYTMPFEEIEEVLAAVASPAGEIRYIASRNAIMVYDTPEAIQLIEVLVGKLDAPPVNLRITVSFDESFEESESGVGIDHGGLVITRERGGRIETDGEISIHGGAGTRTGSTTTSQFLLTRDDHPARIWVGESVARPAWIYDYGVRRGWWRRGLVYQEIGASLWIHPRRVGEHQIEVEVYPRITVEGETPLSVSARELSSRVVVSEGREMELGGLDEERREAYLNLFGIGRVFNGRHLTITLRADIMRP